MLQWKFSLKEAVHCNYTTFDKVMTNYFQFDKTGEDVDLETETCFNSFSLSLCFDWNRFWTPHRDRPFKMLIAVVETQALKSTEPGLLPVKATGNAVPEFTESNFFHRE